MCFGMKQLSISPALSNGTVYDDGSVAETETLTGSENTMRHLGFSNWGVGILAPGWSLSGKVTMTCISEEFVILIHFYLNNRMWLVVSCWTTQHKLVFPRHFWLPFLPLSIFG